MVQTTEPSGKAKRVAAAAAIATALAVPAEGLRQWAYYDPPGILTVCYGHTGGVEKGRKYSLDECKGLLTEDMMKAVTAVEDCRPGLPVEVLAAFSDAVYNMGPTIACNSTASRMLARHETDPGSEFAPRLEGARISDGCRDRGGTDHTDARNGLKSLARLVGPMLRMNAAIKQADLRLQRGQLFDERLQGLLRRLRQ